MANNKDWKSGTLQIEQGLLQLGGRLLVKRLSNLKCRHVNVDKDQPERLNTFQSKIWI